MKSMNWHRTAVYLMLAAAQTALLPLAHAADEKMHRLDFDGGTVDIKTNGQLVITGDDPACTAMLSVDCYTPGWRRETQDDVTPTLTPAASGDQWQWHGEYTKGGAIMKFEQTVWDRGDKVEVEYRLDRPVEYEIQERSRGPFLSVQFEGECFDDRNIMIGNRTVTLPISNIWGNGNQIVIPGVDAEIKMTDWAVLSVWNTSGRREARAQLISQTGKQPGPKTYVLRFTIEKQQTEVQEEPVEKVLSIKLRSYPRILEKAPIAGVDTKLPEKWLTEANTAFDADNESEAKYLVNQSEDWFDAQGRVYDVQDRLTHLQLFNEIFDGPSTTDIAQLQSQAVAALNAAELDRSMELSTQARTALDEAETAVREQYGFGYFPMTDYNPFSWLKVFETLGYIGPSDDLTPGEPYPNAITWPSGGAGAEDSTLSLVPQDGPALPDFEVERTWVRNTWRSPAGPSYTFSVLTPLIAVDNITELPLSGFPSTPTKLAWAGQDGMDFDQTSNQSIDLSQSKSAWYWLRGSRFSLLLFPTVQPAAMHRDGNNATLTLSEKGSVSLMHIPTAWLDGQVKTEAAFWASVAVKAPKDVVDAPKDDAVTHHYLYADRPNHLDTPAKVIAPVPPLTVMHNKDSDWQTSAYRTSAGEFRYVESDTLTVPLRERNITQRRGINEYLARLNERRVQEFADMDIDWVRVCFGTKDFKGDPQEAYDELDVVLTRLGKHGMKALVDPHDFQFKVHDWSKGIPEDPEERQAFLDLWKNLAEVSIKHPDVVVGYDLYNELKVRKPLWHTWDKLATEAIEVIRPIDPNTPIYISGVEMSNPSGYFEAAPIEQENLVYSFHFYAPHSFSHQKIFRASTNDAFVFYPGWIPQIDWKNNEVYGKSPLQWWDRWTIAASMWPVLKFAAANDVAFHCGEVAPIGYSRKKASDSSGLWTRDAIDVLEQHGIPWHLWNQGFGLVIEPVADVAKAHWSDNSLLPADER